MKSFDLESVSPMTEVVGSRRARRACAWFALLCAGLSASACRGTVMVRPDPVVSALPVAHDPMEVRSAVVQALQGNRFVLESETPGQFIVHVERHGQIVRAAVDYGASQFVVQLLGTEGFEMARAGDGSTLVDERAMRVVRSLRAHIQDELALAARAHAIAMRGRTYAPPPQPIAYEAPADQSVASPPRFEVNPGAIMNVATTVLPPLAPAPTASTTSGQSYTVHQSQTQGTQSITCCVNGSLFNCPDQEQFQQCVSLGQHACTPAGRCQ